MSAAIIMKITDSKKKHYLTIKIHRLFKIPT